MKTRAWSRRAALFACLCAAWTAAAASAADWPTYRADNSRSGIAAQSPRLPLELQWTFQAGHVTRPAWPAPAEELPRMHVDSAYDVVAAGGTACFGSPVTNRLYAVDVASGEVRWTFFAQGPIRFAPAMSGGRVYFGSDDGRVYCLDAANGKLVWSYRPGPDDSKVIGNGRMISTWPIRTSVAVDDGQVFGAAGVFPFEGVYVFCLDARDGSVIWKNDSVGARSHDLPFGGLSPHGYLLLSKSLLYVPCGRSLPFAFDRKTGNLHFFARPPGKRGGTWALLAGDRLIAGTEASGVPDKLAYDAETGQSRGDAITWAREGIDLIVTPHETHVVTPTGIQSVDRAAQPKTDETPPGNGPQYQRIAFQLEAALRAVGCPKAVPPPDVHLGDLKPLSATCGSGTMRVNRSVAQGPLSLAGTRHEKGLGTHSFSEIAYALEPEYKAFVAVVGVDDGAANGSVAFEVLVDGKLLAQSPTLLRGETWNFCVPVPKGGKQIRLVSNTGRDGLNSNDMADWVNSGFVTRDAQPENPPPAPAPELAAEIDALRKKLDAIPKKTPAPPDAPKVRVVRQRGLNCLLRAGHVLFAGGEGRVLALDAQTDEILWTADVEGRTVGLAAADGRLFVNTDRGRIHCFGPGARPTPGLIATEVVPDPLPKDTLSEVYRAAADAIVKETGIKQGFCVVRDFGTGRLALELARQTELTIIGLETNPEKLAAARQTVEKAGLLGRRIVVEPWNPADLPEYFANLIVSDSELFARTADDFDAPWRRLMRPAGGTIALCRRGEGGVAVERLVRAELEGAGNWTSLYGNGGNTACSEDQLVKGPFGLLWYGEPGPSRMVERHARAVGPVSIGGRLFVQGAEVVMAYDAYNGTALWQRPIPGAVRIRADADGGNLAATESALYVAAHDQCHRLDPATGRTVRTYTMPRAEDGSARRWGYIAASGRFLLGTTARPLPNEYGHIWKDFVDPVTGGWKTPDEVQPEQRWLLDRVRANLPAPDADARSSSQRNGDLWGFIDRYPTWGSSASPQKALTDAVKAADSLFALDAETGAVLWSHRGTNIPNIGIALDNGVVYFVEKATDPVQRDAALREKQVDTKKGLVEPDASEVPPEQIDIRIVTAAKLDTGEVLWRKPVETTGCGGDLMGLAVRNGVLLFFGHFSNHDTGLFLDNRLTWRRITALDTKNGGLLWSRPLNYLRRPLIVGDTVIIEPRACDLRTGRIKTRPHPITGQPVPWEFLRPGHCCSITSASANALFYRSACSAIYDLGGDSGLNMFGAIRPGCWLNMISAGGVMLMPEASSGCTCSYPLRGSVALVHKSGRTVDDATVFITHGATTPVRRLAVNLGANGDARDERGDLWLAYPRPKAVSGIGYGEYGMKFPLDVKFADGMGYFCREFRDARIDGTERPWLFASGCSGLLRCELPLVDNLAGERPARYTVRLGFAAPAGDRPGRRVFDVKAQGKTVLEAFDIVKEAGGANRAVVKVIGGLEVANALVLEFVPRRANPTAAEAPVVNFIEVVREDDLAEQPPRPPTLQGDRARDLIAQAHAAMKLEDRPKALALSQRVFEEADAVELRLEALELLTAIASPESLRSIRRDWDAALAPILDAYRRTDPKVFDGMARLRLAIATTLSRTDRVRAAQLVQETGDQLGRISAPELRTTVIERLGYVTRWRLLGPMPWGEKQTSVRDVLAAAKTIDVNGPVTIDGMKLDWKPYTGTGPGVDLLRVLGGGDYVATYAHAEIALDEPQELRIALSGDDDAKCWFNGKPVERLKDKAGNPLPLLVQGRKGANALLVLVVNERAGWSFSVRVTDSAGRPLDVRPNPADSDSTKQAAESGEPK